ncbi:MAG: YwiC-like family protein [Chloroflexota bacterium]
MSTSVFPPEPATGEPQAGRPISFKSVALPAEHGSWSLVSEPIFLGLLVAPSWAGVALVVAAFALFLLNRPLKILWADSRRGRRYQRTRMAGRFVLIYSGLVIAGATVALILGGWRPFVPFAVAMPLLLIFMYYDQRPGRHWQAELLAPVAFASVVASVALAGGFTWIVSAALWGFMIGRAVPAVLFVRARLRLDKGKPVSPWGVVVVHILAVGGVALLVMPSWLPTTAAIAALFLLSRAIWGLSAYRWRSSVKALGFMETGIGIFAVVLVAFGFWIR